MALCESQLDSTLPQVQSEDSSPRSEEHESPDKKPKLQPNGDIYVPDALPLSVDYRSPVSHFVPPVVAAEMYAARHKPEVVNNAVHTPTPTWHNPTGPAPPEVTAQTVGTPPPKRKRGRPRIDKTSPEYLANLAARKQAREMAAMMSGGGSTSTPSGEKRKRGRPRVDKTSPEYLARKRARELAVMSGEKRKRGRPRVDKTSSEYLARKQAREIEALERKAKREYRRRTTGDSAASSSAGESPRVKRKYTKRTPSTKKSETGEKVKGKRGRPRKVDQNAANNRNPTQQPKIRVRSNLMPVNSEPITLDSDDEPDLGSPSQASDSLSLDENLRALRHIHEKYANIDKDDIYEAHLLTANFKKPPVDNNRVNNRDDDEVLSIRSSEGNASVKELDTRVEKLEDSSNSDSDSSSSGSGSSSSGSSSSSSSGSSSSSDSSDSESDSDTEKPAAETPALAVDGEDETPAPPNNTNNEDDRSFGAWSYSGGNQSDSDSDSDPERFGDPEAVRAEQEEISESENESADKSFQCHICKKWYSTRVTLKIHRRGHLNRGGSSNSRSRTRSWNRYECDCCNQTFNRREKLWEHKAAEHRGAMTVRCSVCRRCFEDDAELAAHDREHTEDERNGRCTECGAVFSRYEQLRRHRVCAHNAAPQPGSKMVHACLQCGKRFSHPHSLTRHMHNHAKQLYRCVVCKASFARADQLAQHLNSHLANYKRLKP